MFGLRWRKSRPESPDVSAFSGPGPKEDREESAGSESGIVHDLRKAQQWAAENPLRVGAFGILGVAVIYGGVLGIRRGFLNSEGSSEELPVEGTQVDDSAA